MRIRDFRYIKRLFHYRVQVITDYYKLDPAKYNLLTSPLPYDMIVPVMRTIKNIRRIANSKPTSRRQRRLNIWLATYATQIKSTLQHLQNA